MGLIFDLAGEPRPRLRREGWGLHAGRFGTFYRVRKVFLRLPPSWFTGADFKIQIRCG